MQIGKNNISMEDLTQDELDMFESIVQSLHLVDNEKLIPGRKLSDSHLIALAALVRLLLSEKRLLFFADLLPELPDFCFLCC